MAEAVAIYGLKVWCERCGARGRWYPHPRLRLRDVVCALAMADTRLCGGKLRAAPRDPLSRKGPKQWEREALHWAPARVQPPPDRRSWGHP